MCTSVVGGAESNGQKGIVNLEPEWSQIQYHAPTQEVVFFIYFIFLSI